jgi:hypothetical protein
VSKPIRSLSFRKHYRYYYAFWASIWLACAWYAIDQWNDEIALSSMKAELGVLSALAIVLGLLYFIWLRKTFWIELKVFDDHIEVHQKRNDVRKYEFSKIKKIQTLPGSLFVIKFEDGKSLILGSMLERCDYVWDSIYQVRSDLISKEAHDKKRMKLISHDHHQKRREFFWKHRGFDFLHWAFLPISFVGATAIVQMQQIEIHQPATYIFRLAMISVLVVIVSAFIFSFTLKKMVFDPRLRKQLTNKSGSKIRDTSFEKSIWGKTKVWQFAFSVLAFSYVLKNDLNLFSITKIKHDIAISNFKKGETIVVDNRFNCLKCDYKIKEGDIVVFTKGYLGEVLAVAGEKIAYVEGDFQSRSLASNQTSYQIPEGHIAVKTGKDEEPIAIIKIDELIGRVKN